MTDRRRFLINLTLATGAVTFMKPLKSFASSPIKYNYLPGEHTLTILHTSNLYGQLNELGNDDKMQGFGGLRNLQEQIQKSSSEGASILAIHTGSIISDKIGISTIDHLQFCRELSRTGYDIVAPGAAEFSSDKNNYLQLACKSGLPVFSVKADHINNNLLPFQIITKGHTRCGIIDVQTKFFETGALLSMKKTADLMTKTALALVKESSCNVVIGMVHGNKQESRLLAQLSGGCDVIVSDAENSVAHNSEIYRNKNESEVIISYAGSGGTMMSRIDLTFIDNWQKIGINSKAIFVGEKASDYLAVHKRFNSLQA